jgi:type IV pilus assembly protein PilM
MPVPVAAGGNDQYLRQQIADAITPVLTELVTELRRSLDFYRNRANGQGVQRILICGGTAKMPGLDRFLAANLDAPVILGNPMENVGVNARTDPEYLAELAPMLPICVGLAVRDMLVDATPRPRGKKK